MHALTLQGGKELMSPEDTAATINAASWSHGMSRETADTVAAHRDKLTATLRKLNVRKPNVRHPTHLYIVRIDKRNVVPDDPIRMPDLPNVLITNKVKINGITSTALLDTRAQLDFINTAFKG